MKNKFLSIILAIILIVPTMFMLSACGVDENVYGKTFVYGTASINFENTYGSESQESMTVTQYLEQHIASIDWQSTLDDKTFSETVQTVERAKELLNNKVNTDIASKFKNFKIIVSAESEHKITLGSTEYTFETKYGGGVLSVHDQESNEVAVLYINMTQGKLQNIRPSFDCTVAPSLPNTSYLIDIKLVGNGDNNLQNISIDIAFIVQK